MLQVMDLAAGHVAALSYMNRPSKTFLKSNGTVGRPNRGGAGHRAYSVFNLGTGKGYTVLEIINAMKVRQGSAATIGCYLLTVVTAIV